jgi:hypothetical protein
MAFHPNWLSKLALSTEAKLASPVRRANAGAFRRRDGCTARRLQRVVARFAQFIDSFDPLINNRST